MKLSIFSAFPQELKYMIKNVKLEKSLKRGAFHIFYAEYSSHKIIFVQTGIGARNLETAFDYVLETSSPDLIVSAGFGGALYETAVTGDLVWASRVFLFSESLSDMLPIPDTLRVSLKLAAKTGFFPGSILTLTKWIKKADIKKMVPDGLSFPVCDMETHLLARLSNEKGAPFLAIRSITDTLNEEIPPDFFTISDEAGQFRLSRALGILLRKPSLIPQSIKLGMNAEIASKKLWHAVKSLIEIL
jgi:adenosylhomocysteine nucleosidase